MSTGGAEFAAQEADQSLAASQDLIAQTGGGGATALAAAASKSKAGIAADIDRQVKQNEMLIQGAYDSSEGKRLASAMEGAKENIDEFKEDASKEKEIEKLTKTYMQQQNQG